MEALRVVLLNCEARESLPRRDVLTKLSSSLCIGDRTCDLSAAERAITSANAERKLTVTQQIFPLSAVREAEATVAKWGDVLKGAIAVFLVNAHETRLSINEPPTSSIGYGPLYRAVQAATDGHTFIFVTDDRAAVEYRLVSDYVESKLRNQFDRSQFDGTNGLLISYHKAPSPLQQEAIRHYVRAFPRSPPFDAKAAAGRLAAAARSMVPAAAAAEVEGSAAPGTVTSGPDVGERRPLTTDHRQQLQQRLLPGTYVVEIFNGDLRSMRVYRKGHFGWPYPYGALPAAADAVLQEQAGGRERALFWVPVLGADAVGPIAPLSIEEAMGVDAGLAQATAAAAGGPSSAQSTRKNWGCMNSVM